MSGRILQSQYVFESTQLINEQSMAITELTAALALLVSVMPEPQLVSMSPYGPPEYATQKDHELGSAIHLARELIAKHAPAPSQEGGDGR